MKRKRGREGRKEEDRKGERKRSLGYESVRGRKRKREECVEKDGRVCREKEECV